MPDAPRSSTSPAGRAAASLSPHPVASETPQAPRRLTPLQQHVRFFDRNQDGKISPQETYAGCRAMGCNRLVSATAAMLINSTMAWPSSRSMWPTLTIHIDGIERAMHGSDTRVYDETGAFDEAHFVRMFERYDRDGDGSWSLREFANRTFGQRNAFDLFGQCATVLEFGMVYYLVGQGGKISREALRKVYDGTLFYELAGEPLPPGWRCSPHTPAERSRGKPVKNLEAQMN